MASFGPYLARCVSIHDGDTITFDIDLGFGFAISGQDWDGKTQLSARIYGINAPELSTSQGKAALAFAKTLIKPGDRCKLISHSWDKYGGRYDADVELPDGRDFAKAMLDAGHAVVMKV